MTADRDTAACSDQAARPPGYLAELVERCVASDRDRSALDFGDEILTYGSLRDNVETWLAWADTHSIPTHSRVAIGRLDRHLIPLTVALSYRGCSVVPVEVDSPQHRQARLRTLGVSVLIELDDAGNLRVLPVTSKPYAVSDEAYVLSTSGSTGTPKEVGIANDSLRAYGDFLASSGRFDADDRVPLNFPPYFDAFFEVLLIAFGVAATVVVPIAREALLVSRFCADRRITVWDSVPSQLSMARRTGYLEPGSLPHVRWALVGGEEITPGLLKAFRAAAPNAWVANMCGPTEMTVVITELVIAPGQDIPVREGRVPIGTALPGVEVRLVPTEDDGGAQEMLARGRQRFDGYLGADDLGDSFLREVSDGELMPATPPVEPTDWYRTRDLVKETDVGLVHLGRLDTVVKVAGRRIDLRVVESVFEESPHVSSAKAVVVDERVNLVVERAVTSTWPDPVVTCDSLRPYARPHRVVWVDTMPLLPNGKIDRRALLNYF